MSVIEELKGLRGLHYNKRFAELYAPIADELKGHLNRLRKVNGRVTLGDLIELIDGYELPFRPTVRALEEANVLKYGFMDALERDGVNLAKLRKDIQAKKEKAS